MLYALLALHILAHAASEVCINGTCSALNEGDAGSLLQAYSSILRQDRELPYLGTLPQGGSEVVLLAEDIMEEQSASALMRAWKELEPNHKWGTLPLIVLMGLAFCLNFIEGNKYALLILIVLWGTSSMTMNVVNKIAVIAIPLPMTLLVVQMLTAAFLLLVGFGPKRLYNEIRENLQYTRRWSLLALFFTSGLITSILALQAGSVILMLVVRNLMPLMSLLIERPLLPNFTRSITGEAVFALAILALGTGLYAALDMRVSGAWTALGYIVLNMIVMITYRLFERCLLVGMPQALSFGSLALLQNVVGLLPVIALVFLWGEHRAVLPTLIKCRQDPLTITIVLFSGCTGLALGYYSLVLQRHITATAFLTLQSSTKLLTILLAIFVLSERPGWLSFVGCMISLLGGTWYGFISNRADSESLSEKAETVPEATK